MIRLRGPVTAAVLLLAALGTPALAQPAPSGSCGAGLDASQIGELLFGRNIKGRSGVTEAQWRRFVDREITPRFPDGFTVYDARGQWRGADKRIVREPSKIVMIVLPGAASDNDRLREIARAYMTRFKQESVGVIVRPGCVTFKP